MATVFFFIHILTGSVGRRILVVVPVDTLYMTSIISSSTVLPLNPIVNLSLAPLSLLLINGPNLGVWPDCWIPRKGSGSTTTTMPTVYFLLRPSSRTKNFAKLTSFSKSQTFRKYFCNLVFCFQQLFSVKCSIALLNFFSVSALATSRMSDNTLLRFSPTLFSAFFVQRSHACSDENRKSGLGTLSTKR